MTAEGVLREDVVALLGRARASGLSYAVRVLRSPHGRALVVLGEAHLKLPQAARLGARIVDAFELRGVEGFPWQRVFGGQALMILIVVPRLLLRALSLGWIKGSTITYARRRASGRTVVLEMPDQIPLSLHLSSVYLAVLFAVLFAMPLATMLFGDAPGGSLAAEVLTRLRSLAWLMELHVLLLLPLAYVLRRRPWSWMIHPLIAILTVRDRIMAEGTVRMFRQDGGVGAALVIMGRAHLPGYEHELVTRYGFRAPS
jgi:hypothetical protein